jgi:hypothetical protein
MRLDWSSPFLRRGPLTWGFALERVTGIEPALSAWEFVPSGPVTSPDLRGRVCVSVRERPLITGVNGLLVARRTLIRTVTLASRRGCVLRYGAER